MSARYPGQCGEAYPEVFTNIPAQPEASKPGQLSALQLQQYFEQGYLVVEDFLSLQELEPCREALNDRVANFAQSLFKYGKIKDPHPELGLWNRLTKLEEQFPGAVMVMHKQPGINQAFCDLLSNDRILNVMEQLLGTSDIQAHPVWHFRTNTPDTDSVVIPWCQTSGYYDSDSYKVHQVTVWVPLIDCDENNGCLQVLPGAHRLGKVADHKAAYGDTHYVYIEEEEMEKTFGVDMKKDPVSVPVKYGSILIFNNLTPYKCGRNQSDKIRWSLDLWYQRTDQPVGFHGWKEGMPLRSSIDPNLTPDWNTYCPPAKQADPSKQEVSEMFRTELPGPWLGRWEVVNRNRHVKAWQEKQAAADTTK